MGDGNCVHRKRGTPDDSRPEFQRPEWVVAKSLLDVNDACTRTLEDLLVHSTVAEEEIPAEQLQLEVDDLIERHERLLDELELARDALESMKSK